MLVRTTYEPSDVLMALFQPRCLLVTGGAGFIGANFVRFVLANCPDTRLVNLDCLTYAGNLENLADVAGDPRYRFAKADVCDALRVIEVCREHRVDCIVHFAAESHVDRSITGPSASSSILTMSMF